MNKEGDFDMFERLLEPITIGSLTLKNRIIMLAIANGLSDFGSVSQRLIDFYVARAEGGVGMIISQSLFVIDLKSDSKADIPFEIEEVSIDDLRRLSGSIKTAGARAGIQLVHMGNQGMAGFFGGELVAPSPIPCLIFNEKPKELTIEEIGELVDQHSEAAQKAKDGGFDMVEIHGAHGYLVSEFLSKYSNKRKDQYGGNPENMTRFACEIISGIRKRLGPDFTLGIRINGADFIPGGTTIEDTKAMAPYLEEAGVDYISVSGGVYGSERATVSPMMEPRGMFMNLAKEIKKVVNVPVITAGRINDPVLAEEILEKGWADIIGMGRPLIADPKLPIKLKEGDIRNIRKCIACNQGCIDRIDKIILPGKDDGEDSSLTCMVNPRVGKESILTDKPATKRKRVLIAGGGPAGMEAARIAAKRGHDVTLMEKEDRLGGQFNLAVRIPLKEEIREEIDYLTYQMERLKIDVLLGKEANLNTIQELSPDVVIVATGARPITPDFSDERIKAITAWDVLDSKEEPGENILIVGGGSVGLETAHFLAKKGKNVIVVEQFNRFAADMGPISRFYLRTRLKELRVTLMKNTKFLGINGQGAIVEKDTQESTIPNVDTIVWAVGSVSKNSLVDELKGHPYEVFIIGDANKPRDALFAIEEGHKAALNI
jgi:2,4-dienoyl-CoA reductase-like NADH-dependent reductase (Old Yellow Enzyme family)/thioredoxin reductase